MTDTTDIRVEEATTNNLKGVTCSIPHGSLTVVTGVSGSGKSSLAFDTVYAEGQRRYVETLSTYARQFLQQMKRPPARAIRNLQPSLALKQHNSIGNARSSVGSITEVEDYMHVLFANAGTVFCYECGEIVRPWSAAAVVHWLDEHASGERIIVIGTIRPEPGFGMEVLVKQLVADGYRKVEKDGDLINLDSPEMTELLDDDALHVVMDRVKVDASKTRLSEAVESAMNFGEARADVIFWDRDEEGSDPRTRRFESRYVCSMCGTPHYEPIPALFKSGSPIGECDACNGFGRRVGIDVRKVVPDPRLTLEEGVITCFDTPKYKKHMRRLLSACDKQGVPVDVPWLELSEEDREFVMDGGEDWYGVRGFFKGLEDDLYKAHIRIYIARFRGYTECETCDGSGLSEEARAVRIDGSHLGQILRRRIEQLPAWLDGLTIAPDVIDAMEHLLGEMQDRLGFLIESGVGYLTLHRRARTLSGGELHRVLLGTNVGRKLTDTCYVLDEPTAGLHADDTEKLIRVIKRLRDTGNTVLVVEHDPDVITSADWIIELGPQGGALGGDVMYEGDVAGLKDSETASGRMLRSIGDALIRLQEEIPEPESFLEVTGACLHNLKDISVKIPHGEITVVTGVSGSGKSTLVHDMIYRKLLEERGQRAEESLGPIEIAGDEFDDIVLVDQSSLQSSTRSCAMTLSGSYTKIRDLFSGTSFAKQQGLTAGDFSFNTPGGRCDRCEGLGNRLVEMHFIADIRIPCDVCDGKRFNDTTLKSRINGKNIADVFEMTIDEAASFFAESTAVTNRLAPLQAVGLGYLRMGQPTAELSGGEAQRMKLASYIADVMSSRKADTENLFIFDEPTVGLHLQDVEQLLRALRQLTDAGHTVVVVEHNIDFILACDWNIDLGPGAGPDGGEVLYTGRLRGLLNHETSTTSHHVRQHLEYHGESDESAVS
jgi:excinuclease ABC subunit A